MVAPSLILLALFIQQTNSYLYSCNPSAACGCSTNSALVNRIVGGEAANSSVWGWIVSIYIAPGFLCGGSILSSTWVLTAAHCLDTTNASQVLVFAGSNAVWSGQSRFVSRMILHAGYNSGTKENDIALLELDTPLNMTDSNVRIACLPSVSSSIYTSGEWPSANQYVVAIGWGRLSELGSTSSSLQQVTIQTITWNDSRCLNDTFNPALQLCAGVTGGGKDSCQGDSGGPLMMFTASNQWMLIGVTSYGIGCARPNNPGIYTRLVYYQNWIANYTNNGFTNPTSSNSANINPYSVINTTTTTTTTTTTGNTTTVIQNNAVKLSARRFFLFTCLLSIIVKLM